MKIKNTLLPPKLPQMLDDGFITANEIKENGMIDIIAIEYDNATAGDYFRCFFDGTDIGGVLITDPGVDFPHIFFQPADGLKDGVYPVYFNCVDIAENESNSEIVYAILNRTSPVEKLEPPVFTDAVGGMLSYEDVRNKQGTNLLVTPYKGNVIGDIVIISFYVKDLSGDLVSESQFSFEYTLVYPDLEFGFNLLIPDQFILLVSHGTAFASYSVRPISSEAMLHSELATVSLFSDSIKDETVMGGSTGYFNPELALIQECYVEYLAAKDNIPLVNIPVDFILTGENYFHSNGLKKITTYTDVNGRTRVHISGNDSSINEIKGNIAGSDMKSTIVFNTYPSKDYSTPWLVVEPVLPVVDIYPLTLRLLGPASYFNIIAADGTIIMVDEEEMQGLYNLYLSQSEVFSFSIKSIKGNSCQLKVTDQSESHIYCEVIF